MADSPMIVRHSNGLPSVALYRELMSVRASSSTSVMASTRSQPAPWHRTHLFRSFLPVPLHCRHCCHSSGITTRNTPLHRRARRAARGASHVCPMADLERVKAPQPVQTATGLEIGSGIMPPPSRLAGPDGRAPRQFLRAPHAHSRPTIETDERV